MVGITHFRAHQSCSGRCLALNGGLQHTGDFRGRHFNHGRIIGLLNAVEQTFDTALFECRNIVELGKIEKVKFAGDVALDLFFTLFIHTVPFVDRHHQRPARLQRKTGHRRILIGDVLCGIEHQYRHIGGFHRLHGFNHREFLHRFLYFAASAHTGGIDNGKRLAVALEIDVDAVACGTGHIESDYPLFA